MKPIVRDLVGRMLAVNALEIRDIDAGQKPFHYSSGNFGPGYIMVKGLVSQRALVCGLLYQLAAKVLDHFHDVEYVAGNATGGMVPGWILAEALSDLTGRDIHYFYVRNTRKIGGHGEQITGDTLNTFFQKGRRGLVCEELVNFAETTTNSALVQREQGYDVSHGACILDYDHERSRMKLKETAVTLISLVTLSDLLQVGVELGYFGGKLVDDYKAFLVDPMGWQKRRGFTPTVREKTA